jgi:hypothetical protein
VNRRRDDAPRRHCSLRLLLTAWLAAWLAGCWCCWCCCACGGWSQKTEGCLTYGRVSPAARRFHRQPLQSARPRTTGSTRWLADWLAVLPVAAGGAPACQPAYPVAAAHRQRRGRGMRPPLPCVAAAASAPRGRLIEAPPPAQARSTYISFVIHTYTYDDDATVRRGLGFRYQKKRASFGL